MKTRRALWLSLALGLAAAGPASAAVCDVAVSSILANGQIVLVANCDVTLGNIQWFDTTTSTTSTPLTDVVAFNPQVPGNISIYYTTAPLTSGLHSFTATGNNAVGANLTGPGKAAIIIVSVSAADAVAAAAKVAADAAAATAAANAASATAAANAAAAAAKVAADAAAATAAAAAAAGAGATGSTTCVELPGWTCNMTPVSVAAGAGSRANMQFDVNTFIMFAFNVPPNVVYAHRITFDPSVFTGSGAAMVTDSQVAHTNLRDLVISDRPGSLTPVDPTHYGCKSSRVSSGISLVISFTTPSIGTCLLEKGKQYWINIKPSDANTPSNYVLEAFVQP